MRGKEIEVTADHENVNFTQTRSEAKTFETKSDMDST